MNQLFGGLERHSVILFGEVLLLGQLELFFAELGDQLECVLELTVALNLEQYGNSCVLLLFRHICEVVLSICQFLGAECDVNVQGTSLCIELSQRSSAYVEGLEVPAYAALNALVGEQQILDNVVVVLDAALRLCETGQIATAVTGNELNLTATLLLEHFGIALCLNHSVDVIERHGAKSTKGLFFLFFGFLGFSNGCFNNGLLNNRFLNNGLFFNNLFNNRFFFNDFFNNFLNHGLFFNNFFVGDESNCIGSIGGLVEVFCHCLCNSGLDFVGNVCFVFFCANLIHQFEYELICKLACSFLCLGNFCCLVCSKIDSSNFLCHFVHCLCNCIGCINVSGSILSGIGASGDIFNQIVKCLCNNCIGILDLIGNNNGLDFGNVAGGFNGDNGISTALFKLDELETYDHRDNDEQEENDENNDSNTGSGCPEGNLNGSLGQGFYQVIGCNGERCGKSCNVECGIFEFTVCQGRKCSNYGVGACCRDLGDLSAVSVEIFVGDLFECPCGNECTVLALYYEVVSKAGAVVKETAIGEAAVLQLNAVGCLCNRNGVGNLSTVCNNVKRVGSNCGKGVGG